MELKWSASLGSKFDEEGEGDAPDHPDEVRGQALGSRAHPATWEGWPHLGPLGNETANVVDGVLMEPSRTAQ
jgi:hypothetical protein